MDPDQCLSEIRDLVKRLRHSRGDAVKVHRDYQDGTDELLERVEAMDEWLVNGGFPPAEWQKKVPLMPWKR